MRTKIAVLTSNPAQATKYVWAAIATLVVVLILGAFVAPAGVAAKAGSATPADLVATKVRLEYAQYRGRGGTTALDSLAVRFFVSYEQYRGRGGFARTSLVAENPELVYARSYSAGQITGLGQTSASTLFAANPELVYAQSYSLGQSTGLVQTTTSTLLAANPELVYAQAYSPGQSTSLGPSTGMAQSSGAVACVLDLGYATLAANPELMYPAIAAAQAAAPGQAC